MTATAVPMSRRPTFEELVRLSALRKLSPAEYERLESDACIERYANELARLITDCQQRIENRRRDRLSQAELDVLFATRDGASEKLKGVKRMMRRRNTELSTGDDVRMLRTEVQRLRSAIRRHRMLSRYADIDPEPFDLELRSHVIVTASKGTRS